MIRIDFILQWFDNNKTSNLFLDSKGKLWIGTNNGLSVIENDKIAIELKALLTSIWISLFFVYKNNCLYNLKEENGIQCISSIFKDSNGRFWIATKIWYFKTKISQ